MNKIRSVISFVVAAFCACFGWASQAHAATKAPPTNQATVVFENFFKAAARDIAIFILRAKIAFARAFPMFDMPLALGVGEDIDKQILKSLEEMSTKLAKVNELETSGKATTETIEKLTKSLEELSAKFQGLQAQRLVQMSGNRHRAPGTVSDACAKHLAADFILHVERSGKLDGFAGSAERGTKLITVARSILGISGKAALTTAEIPLPVEYGAELKELISEFGVARKKMMRYPIGMGTARPPRMGTRPAFGSIAMSAAIGEKAPAFGFASLESHKIGGLVRLPRELDEQSIVPLGQFLAFYGAVEFARAEDTWAFLADGSGTYENVVGLVKHCVDNNKHVEMAADTGPQDVTIADLRLIRTKVNKAALSGKLSAYYFDSTWEVRLRTFNTEADPYIFVIKPDGTATLDGYPIVWTDVLEPYAEADVVNKCVALFGALQFWWMGEHGSPRIDTSEHVFFANDQLATRFIEEIDFDYCAIDAVAALITGD